MKSWWIALGILVSFTLNSYADTASYYTRASCRAEGTSGIMANGKELNDEALTAASWDYKFGTRLEVTNKLNGRKVVVQVTDRGPNKKLYRAGRKIDLSLAAFRVLAETKQGVIPVEIRRVK